MVFFHYFYAMEKDAVLYFYQKIGRNIKNIRREKDLKAFDVAAQLGIGESTYTKIERGETKIGLDKIQDLARIFSVPFETFLIDKENHEYYHFDNSPNSGKIQQQTITISQELLDELKNQLHEKDKQIAILLQKIK